MRATQQGRKPPGKAKRRILTAAARLFRKQGFDRTSVRELADAVGILSGSLFHHFRSKDDILFAVMEEVIVAMDAALAEALETATTTEDRLRALIHTELEFIHGEQSDATTVLVYEWHALSREGQTLLMELRNRYFARWQEVLDAALSCGLVLVEPVALRQLIHGATVWTAHWYRTDGPMSLAELENALLTLLLNKNYQPKL